MIELAQLRSVAAAFVVCGLPNEREVATQCLLVSSEILGGKLKDAGERGAADHPGDHKSLARSVLDDDVHLAVVVGIRGHSDCDDGRLKTNGLGGGFLLNQPVLFDQ